MNIFKINQHNFLSTFSSITQHFDVTHLEGSILYFECQVTEELVFPETPQSGQQLAAVVLAGEHLALQQGTLRDQTRGHHKRAVISLALLKAIGST